MHRYSNMNAIMLPLWVVDLPQLTERRKQTATESLRRREIDLGLNVRSGPGPSLFLTRVEFLNIFCLFGIARPSPE